MKRSAHFGAAKRFRLIFRKQKPARLTNFRQKYRKGQAIMHPTFGQGEVTAVVDGQKIDVLFGDDVKR